MNGSRSRKTSKPSLKRYPQELEAKKSFVSPEDSDKEITSKTKTCAEEVSCNKREAITDSANKKYNKNYSVFKMNSRTIRVGQEFFYRAVADSGTKIRAALILVKIEHEIRAH